MSQRLVWSGTWSGINALADRWAMPEGLALRAQALGHWSKELYGIDLFVNSGGRSGSNQLRLREAFRRGEPGIFKPASCSSHLTSLGRILRGDSTGEAFDASPALGSRSISSADWQRIGSLAVALGLRWGGRNDPVHFDSGAHLALLRQGRNEWCI